MIWFVPGRRMLCMVSILKVLVQRRTAKDDWFRHDDKADVMASGLLFVLVDYVVNM